ncbi:MAG: ABC transporter substrate-binding protein, partial [Chloroflexi bacterium]|nr:ABC transporter substrate-binding protein [Chloroflexota bacterium]
MATDLSGSAALLGVAGVNGVTLAVEDLNAAGGVLGKKIELIVRNTEGRPEAGTREVRDLIQREKVAALMGPVSSAVGLAESAVAKENKVPIFLHTSNTERLTVDLGHPYVFSVVPNTGIEGRAQAIDMAKLPYKTYYIIGPDYEFGHLEANAFKEKMKELRPDVQFVGGVQILHGQRYAVN